MPLSRGSISPSASLDLELPREYQCTPHAVSVATATVSVHRRVHELCDDSPTLSEEDHESGRRKTTESTASSTLDPLASMVDVITFRAPPTPLTRSSASRELFFLSPNPYGLCPPSR